MYKVCRVKMAAIYTNAGASHNVVGAQNKNSQVPLRSTLKLLRHGNGQW